jgi:hypothetical protein
MRVPALLYGREKEVQQLCKKSVRDFLNGVEWDEAFASSSTTETTVHDALLVMNGPAPLLSSEVHFRMYVPLAMLLEQMRKGGADEADRDRAMSACLKSAWGTLGVLAPKNQMLVYPAQWHRPVVRAAARWWEAFAAVGCRFTLGLRDGKDLWDTVTNLHYVLGQIGIPIDAINAPLPPGGLLAILPLDLHD